MDTFKFDDVQKDLFSSLLSNNYDIETEDGEIPFEEDNSFGVVDEEDRRILLHRDAHFSGSFPAMLEYYERPDARGVHDEISYNRIAFLADVEKRLGRDIAPLILAGADAEKIAWARKMYADIQKASHDNPNAALFSTILLHEENELEFSEEDLQKLSQHPSLLLMLASSEEFRDELAPGYGKAPLDAIRLIGKLKIREGMEPLLRLLATAEGEEEEELLFALYSLGDEVLEKACSFLASKPLTPFHERMALLLLQFLPDPRAVLCANTLLKDKEIERSPLAKWLMLANAE